MKIRGKPLERAVSERKSISADTEMGGYAAGHQSWMITLVMTKNQK
jgi:hypothetical protein